jgi:hypothetical protein
VVVVTVAFFAALVNGAVGFGFALLGVVALAFVLDPKSVVIVISLVTPFMTLSQLWRHRAHRLVLSKLELLLVASAIGCVVGIQLLVVLPTWALSIAMGLFALSYALTALRRGRPPLSAAVQRRLGPLVGFLAGILSGAVGASGPILGPYLHAIGLQARAFAFAISAVFTVMSLVRIVSIAAFGAYTSASLLLSALIVVPAFVGQRVGFVVQQRIDHQRFELAVLVLVMLSGVNLVIKGVAEVMAT